MGVRGTAMSCPRRRRGGGRGARRGGVARGAGLQREGKWVQEVAGAPRVAVGEAGGGLRPSSAVGGAELCRKR